MFRRQTTASTGMASQSKESWRVWAKDYGSHPDEEIYPKHDKPQQQPSPSHDLELNPEPTTHISPSPSSSFTSVTYVPTPKHATLLATHC